MPDPIITLKIDVKKLDKKRFFEGEKGLYADLVLIPTPGGKFGDYMVKQQITKEEREANEIQMPILGNGKIIGRQGGAPKPARGPVDEDEIPYENPKDDCPF